MLPFTFIGTNMLYNFVTELSLCKSIAQTFPFFSDEFIVLQLVLSACVAAVQCRPVIHNWETLFFFSSGIMDCMLLTFENRVPLMR